MRPVKILLFIGLILISGCIAIPTGESPTQEDPVPVVIENNATQTQTFTVAVVNVGQTLTEHKEGNRTTKRTIGQGSSTIVSHDPILRIEFPDSARIYGKYTLDPRERKQLSIENVSSDQAIVITVYDENEGQYRAIKSLNCDGPILGYKVITKSGDLHNWTPSSHKCG